MMPTTTTSKNHKSFTPAIILAAFLSLLAFGLFLLLTESTAEFLDLGILGSLMGCFGLAFFLLPTTIFIIWIVAILQKQNRFPLWIKSRHFVSFGVALMLCALLLGLMNARAKVRLMKVTDGEASNASHIQVAGFQSFLGARWLYSFDATAEDVTSIAESMKLAPIEKINFKVSLNRDIYFKNCVSPIKTDIPDETVTLAYASNGIKESSRWVTLVYSASSQRAWLYTGFQH